MVPLAGIQTVSLTIVRQPPAEQQTDVERRRCIVGDFKVGWLVFQKRPAQSGRRALYVSASSLIAQAMALAMAAP